jgi:hypothetical protein
MLADTGIITIIIMKRPVTSRRSMAMRIPPPRRVDVWVWEA